MTTDRRIQGQLVASIERGDLEQMGALITSGADVNFRGNDPDGETPLLRAISTGQTRVVQFLVNCGADVNVAARLSGWTPLMFAHGNPEMLELLVAAGANVNARSKGCSVHSPATGRKVRRGGETALHFAAAANIPESVQILLRAGAEVEAVDESGLAALDVALRAGSVSQAAAKLVEAGAELTPERLELMHSGAIDPAGTLSYFPAIDLLEPGSREQPFDTEPRGDNSQKAGELNCPHCGTLTYSRKARICGACGRPLEAAVQVEVNQAEMIAEERKWAKSLADKFDSKRRDDATVARKLPLEAASLSASAIERMRRASCAEEFRKRGRPRFWMKLFCYSALMGAFYLLLTRVLPEWPLKVMLIALGTFVIGAYYAWYSADPICPNCAKDIKQCGENFCHSCGKQMVSGICSDCGVRRDFREVIPKVRWIDHCPNCGVWLDSKLFRPRFW